MTKEPSRDADSVEQHIARLAAIVEQHGLTHLEYQFDGGRVVLDKAVPTASAALRPAIAAGLSAEEMDVLSEFADTRATGQQSKSLASKLRNKANAIQSGEAVATAGAQVQSGDTAAAEVAANAGETGELIPAPLVGIAYAAKEPGAAPFVKVGDKVEEGTVLCLIEAMKMFNEVKAPKTGTITKIHFKDGALVEYGAPLFSLQD